MALRDRAELVRAAGLSTSVSEHRLSDTELDAHRVAIEDLLSSHEPYPACAMDPYGRVVALNGQCALLNPGIEALTPEALVDAAVGPGPARNAIVNFAGVAHAYTDRLERRARAGTDPMLRALADRAHQHVADIPRPRHDATNPTLRIQLRIDEQTTLSMLAAVVKFEHATDITVAELWIELLFPADDDTRRWFETSAGPTANRSERATPAGNPGPTVDAAQARFDEFAEQWRERYPAMIDTWERSWGEFTPFLAFPVELRTIVYTTNAIESLNARFRKAVRHRGHFPNEQAALKVLYLVATQRRPNRSNPTGRINAWKGIPNALTIHYGDRIQAAN